MAFHSGKMAQESAWDKQCTRAVDFSGNQASSFQTMTVRGKPANIEARKRPEGRMTKIINS